MDIQALETFMKVCEQRSITKAARTLEQAPSVISRQIARLERAFGGKLFSRTGRGVALTDLGQRVLPQARTVLAECRALSLLARSQDSALAGEVRIGLVPSLLQPLIPDLFRAVTEQHPGIRLQVLEGASGQLDAWITNELVDIAILFRSGAAGSPAQDPVSEVGCFLIGPEGDTLTAAPQVPFHKLDGLPLVLAPAPNGLRLDVELAARQTGVTLNVALETNSVVLQGAMASQGLAYSIMAGHAATQQASLGVQISRIVEPALVRLIVLLMATDRPVKTATLEVARLLRSLLQQQFSDAGTASPADFTYRPPAFGPD